MTDPAKVLIIIGTPYGLRHLASSSERKAAWPAEAVLKSLGRDVRSASLWVLCEDPGVAQRLTSYLQSVKAEVVAEAEAGVRLG
ncbi:hypothetical protein MMMDOFMJ_3051 [Methylobacterium gnaphalii]|uniref:Uncharacterized protein n=1 Tax=Methylobacterium gnaphalii TaxID=1010610 RepID=A0A512JMP3_9HYPH|nr:hypothetical protein MGN01_30860 [Methylobacterium gnaphalii]GJD70110.1 hypothetical protein MMMDOFMJ_3051 [Methylobacterium gnaphalii]GLS49745.1 hypothetical protein GCM10007885_25950 [Methylobacterium gnaphalii]